MEVFDRLLWSLAPQSPVHIRGLISNHKKSLENIWLGYIWYNWIFDRFEWKMDIININNIFGFGIIRLHYYFMRMLDVSYLYDESSCSTKVFWSMLMSTRFRSTKVNFDQPRLTLRFGWIPRNFILRFHLMKLQGIQPRYEDSRNSAQLWKFTEITRSYESSRDFP